MSCRHCTHWKRSGGQQDAMPEDAHGDCRRHPPRIVGASLERGLRYHGTRSESGFDPSDLAYATHWPVTFGDQGCGEEENPSPC